jgi:hypothetical protein
VSMPLYHRMKFELVLASCLGDWWEAEDALNRCEIIWQSTHAYHKQDADADADANDLVQQSLRDIREVLDRARAQHDVQPHAAEDPSVADDEDFEYDDGDLRMVDDFDEDEEDEENEDEEAQDITMEFEQSVEETVEEADKSLKSMPSDVGSSMPAATGEVEEPVSSEPSSKAVDVKSWARLTPKLSADLPKLAFRRTTTKSAQVSPLPPASATMVSTAGASKQGLVSKLVSQVDTREKDANTTSAADRKFKSPKATVKKEPEPEPRKKSAAPASPTIAKREPKTD